MSDYDTDPLLEDFNPSGELLLESQSPAVKRKSARIASTKTVSAQREYQQLVSSLKAQGVSPAPGLQLSQLHELASLIAVSDSPIASPAPAGETPVPTETQRGRKRTRKSDAPYPKSRPSSTRPFSTLAVPPSPAALAGPSAPASVPAAPTTSTTPPTDVILSTMQSLVRSVQTIDSRLQSLENASASVAHATVSQPGLFPQPGISISEASHSHSLASAVPAPLLGRPYIPSAANISPRLRSKILQGKDINLVSLILPSPECDKKVSTTENITTVIKSADPRLTRDLAIGEFLVAFGIYRDILLLQCGPQP